MTLPRPMQQRGATLVELVVSIVIISVGLAGVLLVMERTTRSSADPMIQYQAIAIAEAYLDEILLKDFCDPDNAAPCTPPNNPGNVNCNVCPPAEGSRGAFDNVCDYNNRTDNGAADQNGAAIAGLDAYVVQTAVDTASMLNGLLGNSCQVLRVQVTVTPPFGGPIVVSGYRTNYN